MEKPNILVVEDNHELADSLKDIFALHDYKTHISVTGKDGLEYALENRPDLTILDIRLPDINGYEVYRKIREDSWGANAKVLILTASESIDNIARNTKLPMKDILFKPDTGIEELLSVVADRLG